MVELQEKEKEKEDIRKDDRSLIEILYDAVAEGQLKTITERQIIDFDKIEEQLRNC